MTITITNETANNTTAGGTLAWDHTVDAGTDILVIAMTAENSSDAANYLTVTYGGVAMTKAIEREFDEGAAVTLSVWYLLNPTVGTAEVTETHIGGVNSTCSVSYNLHDAPQQAPEVTGFADEGASTDTVSLSTTTLTDDAIMLSFFCSNTELTVTSDVTDAIDAVCDRSGSGNLIAASSFTQATAGAKNITWTLDSGVFGRATMVNVVFSDTLTSGLALTDIDDKRIFQRVGTTKDVLVEGTYTGPDPDSVEARVVDAGGTVLDWTTLTSVTIGSGTFSGTLPAVPQGGGNDSSVGYILEIRSKDSGDTVLDTDVGTNRWGVGRIVAVIGSSTARNFFTDGTALPPSNRVSKFNESGWANISGAAAIEFSNKVLTDESNDIPIGMLDYGVGGTTLGSWQSNSYSHYLTAVAAVAEVGGLEMTVCHVGSNDARGESVPSASGHETEYRTLINNWWDDTTGGVETPFFIAGCQRAPNEPVGSGSHWTNARQGEMDVTDDANIFLGSTVVDLEMAGDNVHLSDPSMETNGFRNAAGVNVEVHGNSDSYLGPQAVASIYYPDTGYIVTTFGLRNNVNLMGRTSQEDLTGMIYKESSVLLVPITEPFVSGVNTVTAKLATGLSDVTLEIHTGTVPDVTNCLFGGKNITYPPFIQSGNTLPLVWGDPTDSEVTFSSGGIITGIIDKSGHNRTLGVTGIGPQTGIDTENGLNVLTFTAGDGNGLTIAGAAAMGIVDIFIFMRVNDTAWTPFSDGSGEFFLVGHDTAAGNDLQYQNVGTPTFYVDGVEYTTTDRADVHGDFDDTPVVFLARNINLATWLNLNIFAFSGGGFGTSGGMGELIIVPSGEDLSYVNYIGTYYDRYGKTWSDIL